MTFVRTTNLVIVIVVVSSAHLVVVAQTQAGNETTKDCSSSKISDTTKPSTMISFGVINGRALHLERPTFPEAAVAVGVRGDVQVGVVIDPNGCVNEAKLLSGHALLSAASVAAARKSSFDPVTISGKAIWVYGIITYKYVSQEMNWLELGYNSADFERMLEFLPTRLQSERILLENVRSAEWNEKENALSAFRSAVLGHGIVDAKSEWLFRFGIWLNDFERVKNTVQESNVSLTQMLESVPVGVNPELVRSARLLLEQKDAEVNKKTLATIKTNMFVLGN